MQLFDLTIQVKCPCPPSGSVLEKYSAGNGRFPVLTESKIGNLTVSDVQKALEWSFDVNRVNGDIVKAIQVGSCSDGNGYGGICVLIECAKGE